MGHLLIKQSTGMRRWVTPIASNGSVKTGLVVGDFAILLVAPNDTTTTAIVPVASVGAASTWIVDIPSAFLVTNGVGSYYLRVVISATGPTYRAVNADSILVTQNLLDDIATSAGAYNADIDVVRNGYALTDSWAVLWRSGGGLVTSQGTSPTLQVVDVVAGTTLFGPTALTWHAATSSYRVVASNLNRMTPGRVYVAIAAVTLGGSSRTDSAVVGQLRALVEKFGERISAVT